MKFIRWLIILIPIISYSQGQDNKVWQVESLYYGGNYQKTIEKIDSVLQHTKEIPDSVLIKLYTYQAFSYVALDKKEQALNSFRYLLILNPKQELDPRFVSPKIIEIFEESKRLKGDSIKIMPSPIVSVDHRTLLKESALRSLMYPGLGQLYKKDRAKAYMFLSLETVSIVGLVASHFLVNSSHQKYLDAREQNEIDRRYQIYSFWYKARIGFAISSSSVWIMNYIDATLSK